MYLMIIESYFLSILDKNLCCGCSLESPRQGDSNEHPQDRILWRNKQNYPLIIIKHHQIPILSVLKLSFSNHQMLNNHIDQSQQTKHKFN